jgi:predicted CoA-substrate-specific enzyme activase
MVFAGVDAGSVTTKVVLLEDDQIIGKNIVPTKADPNLAASKTLEKALDLSGISQEEVKYTVSTGYGRRIIKFGDKTVTEITANAKGAFFLGIPEGKIRTIIDLGGQDSKAISLLETGEIANFAMNDKCSAGTGRFLEVMAHALDVELDNIGPLSLESTTPLTINSTCTVFAESEVISLIAQGKDKRDILAGLHRSIAKKIGGLARQVGLKNDVFFDGGGAKNIGIRKALENELNCEVYVPEKPQFVIALGAALFAKEYADKL